MRGVEKGGAWLQGDARDVPRVALVDCRVTLFVDDLVCILDSLAQVSGEGRVRWRDGGEEGEGWVCWSAGRILSRPGWLSSAPPHSSAVAPRPLPCSEMDKVANFCSASLVSSSGGAAGSVSYPWLSGWGQHRKVEARYKATQRQPGSLWRSGLLETAPPARDPTWIPILSTVLTLLTEPPAHTPTTTSLSLCG